MDGFSVTTTGAVQMPSSGCSRSSQHCTKTIKKTEEERLQEEFKGCPLLRKQLEYLLQQLSETQDMNKKLLSYYKTENQKVAAANEKLKKMKAELKAARQKEHALKEELKKTKAELAQTSATVNSNDQGQGKGREHEEMEALRSQVLSTVKNNNSVTMDAVGGMNDVKEALLDAIVLPKKSAQRPGLALLYGPSGTGKTHIVSAVAHRSDCTLFVVKASDIGSKWHGESEKKITLLFEEAQKQDYSIIFIDELDCICSNRDRSTHDYGRKILTSFLTEINRIGDDINNVAVLAATNKPWDLDRAVQDRFDTKIYVPLPDLETRKSILKLQMKRHNHSLNGDDFQRLAQLMQGATAREVGSLEKRRVLGL